MSLKMFSESSAVSCSARETKLACAATYVPKNSDHRAYNPSRPSVAAVFYLHTYSVTVLTNRCA